jgi:hypothetical protein
MNVASIIAIVSSILALITFAIVRERRQSVPADLGWVTEEWLAEYRAH